MGNLGIARSQLEKALRNVLVKCKAGKITEGSVLEISPDASWELVASCELNILILLHKKIKNI